MFERSSIILDGARLVRTRQRILWWIFAVNLILAAGPAMPLSHRIGDVTDHSLAANRLVDGFDLGMFSELLTTPNVNFGRAFPESAATILVFSVFMLFLTGGILASYENEYKLSTRDFFASCGAFFWRSVRLLGCFLVVVVPVAYASQAALHWTGRLVNDAAGEKTGYAVGLGFALLALFLLMALRLWFDMAQIRSFVEDERAVRHSLARSFRLTFSNFGPLFWLYLRITSVAWVALAMGLWLCTRLSGGAAVFVLEIVLLVWIGSRLWQRASAILWYQRRSQRAQPVAFTASPISEPPPLPPAPVPATE